MRSCNDLAIITQDQTLTYLQANAHVAGIVKALRSQGIKPGQTIAFIPDKSIASILTFFALWRLGCAAFPISHHIPQVQNLLDQTSAILIQPKLYSPSKPIHQKLHVGEIATYMQTSGSSAEPKIAIHTLANHIYSALGVNSYFSLRKTDRWELSLPLYHIGGIAILWRCFLTGAAVTIDQPFTHISWIPTQLMRNLDNPPKCKAILLGGAPLSTSLALQTAHLPIYPSYGLTEMTSTVLIKEQPLPYRRVKRIDGELIVSGPTLFQGYLNQPLKNSWFATGDLIDSHFHIIGRKDRLFISGGENIQPEEIEQALTTLPNIQSAHVVPVSDKEFGKRPVAFIQSKTHYSLNELRELLNPILPRFKHPIAAFPLPETEGKISHKHLETKAAALIPKSVISNH